MAYVRANVLGTQAILEFARMRGINAILFASSSSVYGDNTAPPFSEGATADRPISPYAASKRAAEMLCASSCALHGTSIVALRFFTVYGPRQRPDLAIRKFATLMLQNREIPIFGNGSTARDYTWIDDILDGVVSALDRVRAGTGEMEVINLGGNRTTTLDQLVQMLASELGVEARIRRMPQQPGDVRSTFADVRRARELLGYVPKTPIEEGIRRFALWMREQQTQRVMTPSASVKPSTVSLRCPFP
jgi:UDP-glucuronate 4-epimerase